jgi:drug/metabolite transporter (DMT)-like permease
MFITFIIILSSIIHATWNFISKTVPSTSVFVWLVATCTSIIYFPIVCVWIWHFGFENQPIQWLFLAVTALVHMIYYLTLQRGYQVSDLSVVYPIARGMGPLFSSIVAFLFLGEQFSAVSGLGLLAVVVGVFFIAGLKKPSNADEKTKKGLVYGVLVGLLIALYTVWDAYAVKYLAVTPLILEYVSHPFRALVLFPFSEKRKKEAKEIWQNYYRKILTISFLTPISFILVLYALKVAPIHFVAPARELSIVFGVFLGGKILLEKDFKTRLLGAFLILFGIILLHFS